MSRGAKRSLIITIYLVLIFLFTTSFYFLIKEDPNCSDGTKNQGETGIDCGGPCLPCAQIIQLNPIKKISTEWVHDLENRYDVIAKMKNPNDLYGVSSFKFRIVATMSDGSMVTQQKWEDSFILPGQEKSFFIHGVELPSSPVSVETEILEDSDNWKKFSDFKEPEFIVNNSIYREDGAGSVDFGKASGTVVNRSSVDFEVVDIHVALRDRDGNLLATNSQRINSVRAGELRNYLMIFPYSFPGSVERVETFVETNPFDSENYKRIYGTPDKWDEILQ